jgi:hypothetical protein
VIPGIMAIRMGYAMAMTYRASLKERSVMIG